METTVIAICDDDRPHVDMLERLLASYFQKAGHAYRLLKFSDGRALLCCKQKFHILFMDIHMPGMDGLEAARILRRINPDFLLIFVSAYMEYAPLGYEVRAFRYLLKPQLPDTLGRCMDAALQSMGLLRERLRLPFVGGEHTVFVDEIVYIESQKHVARFYLCVPQRELYLYETLDNLARLLPAGQFTRVHKSYLAGLRFMENALNYTAVLSTGHTLPISQKRFAQVKRDLLFFKGKT